MNIKSLLLGSAAALVAVSGARAADAIVAAEPEPVEYVRVCDAFGTGYFYIPGTETCLRIHGYLRYDIQGGDLFAHTSRTGDETYSQNMRFSFRTSTASETELGTLRTYTETRFNWSDNQDVVPGTFPVATANGYSHGTNLSLNFAWIQLGGLRVGKDESLFTTFTGYAGAVINDGSYGPFDTNLISYTYNGGAFRAAIALEQGASDTGYVNGVALAATARAGWGIDDYMPHVVVGLGYNAGMVDLSGVFAWDSRDDLGAVQYGGWAAKLRADVAINDMASVFAMVMYGENSSGYTTWANGARTDETWSVIGGGSLKVSEKATINLQGQWIESNIAANSDAWSIVGNVNYTLVPGLVITPELVYADSGVAGTDGDFGAMLRVQRSF
ncbi:porin [Hoeflea sp. G2-23]|uniref:Porin n=1 Tax=Hoeflea algicola TaxID=2983763 RepID=A0ABT3Z792_9HYPH|nr:porin [Hoeflea algicola]MCY0147643.1 porin [Hoeflea algicola]